MDQSDMMEAQRGMRDADMEKMMAIEEELSRLDTPEPAASAGGHRVKRVSLVVPPSPPAKDVEEKLTFPARPNPLRVNPVDEPRPMTSSSRRLSFSTIATFKRPIKFGKGKYANVELVPQPSDDEDDPLNWPLWKKELHYATLLVVVAMAGMMKTAFFSLNGRLATGFSVSYTAVAALTGVPLMVSAASGMASLVLARLWGKRPVYLASTLLMFVGAFWSIQVTGSFAQCMASRVFQGIGWGALDVLVLGSIYDTYFDHQLGLRLGIYNTLAVCTTWGPPLVAGAVFDRSDSFKAQFGAAAYFFQTVALLAVVFGVPETAFDRSFYQINTPASAWSNKMLPLRPRRSMGVEKVKEYLAEMKPWCYEGPVADAAVLLQAPRALVAPTTALLALVSLLPFCALWALSSSLGLLFSPLPFDSSTAAVGLLLTGPWLLATATVAFFAFLPRWHRRFELRLNAASIATGTTVAFLGLLIFGLYAESRMRMDAAAAAADASSSAFAPGSATMSFPVVSLLLGLVALSAFTLDATVRPLVRRSASFTSSNLAICLRNTVDMSSGVGVWRSLFAGIFVIAMPNAVWSWDGLKAACAALAVVQILVASAVGALWWRYEDGIRRLDGRVMSGLDASMLKRAGSFFDMD